MSDQLFKRGKELQRQRKEQERNERAKVLIICEDSKSSVTYFEQLCKKYRIDGRVEICGEECGSAPISVVNYAIARCEEKESDYDQAFCVIDRDTHERFDEALDKAKRWVAPRRKNTVLHAIVSYPCFELWLLLHFIYTARSYANYTALLPALNEQLARRGYSPYDKGCENIFALFFPLTDSHASIHAKRLESDCQQTGNTNPSTKIHDLITSLQKIRDRR